MVVYGDVNSTLAAALVGCEDGRSRWRTSRPGLRSFDMTMPEEVNRRVTDILSDLLFATSPEAIGNLAREGVAADRIRFVGNPMIDTLLANLERFDAARARAAGSGSPGRTRSRPSTGRPTSTAPRRPRRLVAMLDAVAAQLPVVLPLHPRGRPTLEAAGLRDGERIHVVEPLGYLDFLSLVRGAAVVVTDSGGIQEETTVLGRPLPDGPAEHGAAHHDHPRHEPPRHPGIRPGRGRRGPRRVVRPARRAAAALGRPRRRADRGGDRGLARRALIRGRPPSD